MRAPRAKRLAAGVAGMLSEEGDAEMRLIAAASGADAAPWPEELAPDAGLGVRAEPLASDEGACSRASAVGPSGGAGDSGTVEPSCATGPDGLEP